MHISYADMQHGAFTALTAVSTAEATTPESSAYICHVLRASLQRIKIVETFSC